MFYIFFKNIINLKTNSYVKERAVKWSSNKNNGVLLKFIFH